MCVFYKQLHCAGSLLSASSLSEAFTHLSSLSMLVKGPLQDLHFCSRTWTYSTVFNAALQFCSNFSLDRRFCFSTHCLSRSSRILTRFVVTFSTETGKHLWTVIRNRRTFVVSHGIPFALNLWLEHDADFEASLSKMAKSLSQSRLFVGRY